MKPPAIFILLYICILSGCFQNGKTTSTVEVLQFKSDVFQNQRKVRVYLPENYGSQESYPVLYLNDGQNLFKNDSLKDSDYWRVDEIVDSLIQNQLIEPLIIVGIDHSGSKNRGNEYLPWEDIYLYPPIPEPQGKKYPSFLSRELMPFINKRYKTKTGAEHTGLGGFSYGGLITIYTAMVTDHFGKVLIESPSLYVNKQRIIAEATNSNSAWPNQVYIGIGTNELNVERCDEKNEDNLMAVNDVKSLLQIIQKQSPDTEIHYEEAACATHSYEEASRRLSAALLFLYSE